MSVVSSKWFSYHIYLPWTGNEFLADFLPRLISCLKTEKQIKRFFFIRFTEGSYHIRLRLQKTSFSDILEIEKHISAILDDFRFSCNLTNSQVWFTMVEYSREEHYFGETLESVYSELINEQTSYLAMQMLSGVKDENYFLLLKFAASLYWLFVYSALDKADFDQIINESYEFAERHKSGNSEVKFNDKVFLQKLAVVNERMSSVSSNSGNLQKTAALLKRVKQCNAKGRFAAMHAIHLYCNKLGFSISQEAQIYELLSKM